MKRIILACLFVACITGCATKQQLKPFTSDGCTLFPDSSFDAATDWSECCLNHDIAYWQGGTEKERHAADLALKECIVLKTNNQLMADLMYNAVRMGGTPHFPTWYRWGYGWKYSREYGPLTEQEKELVRAGLDQYRQSGSTDTMEPAPE